MAPFVEMEWGRKAYGLMWELKELFDPDYVLNPGVVLNQVRIQSAVQCHVFCLHHRLAASSMCLSTLALHRVTSRRSCKQMRMVAGPHPCGCISSFAGML